MSTLPVVPPDAPASLTRSARFVRAVDRLFARDRGLRARLHRNAGLLAASGNELVDWYAFLATQPYLLTDLPTYAAARREQLAYLVACLMAADRRHVAVRAMPMVADGGDAAGEDGVKSHVRESFGRTLRRLVQGDVETDAVTRRLRVMLDADLDQDLGGTLPYRLRRLVTLALSRGARIDWARLLDDLDRWTHPDRGVQRTWARDFFAPDADAPVATVPAMTAAT